MKNNDFKSMKNNCWGLTPACAHRDSKAGSVPTSASPSSLRSLSPMASASKASPSSKVSLLGETYGRGSSIINHQSSIKKLALLLFLMLGVGQMWGATTSTFSFYTEGSPAEGTALFSKTGQWSSTGYKLGSADYYAGWALNTSTITAASFSAWVNTTNVKTIGYAFSTDKGSTWGTEYTVNSTGHKYCEDDGYFEVPTSNIPKNANAIKVFRTSAAGTTTYVCSITLTYSASSTTPYTGDIYPIGQNFTWGWTINDMPKMTNDGKGNYTWSGWMNGSTSNGFKFLCQKSDNTWYPAFMPKTADQAVSAGSTKYDIQRVTSSTDYKFKLSTSGYYTITLDLTDKDNGKMTISNYSPELKTIYFDPGVWNTSDPKYFIHAWGGSCTAQPQIVSTTVCGSSVWKADVPSGTTGVIVTRQASSTTACTFDWNNGLWNRSGDITLNSNNKVSVTGWSGAGKDGDHDLSSTSVSTYAVPTYSITFNGNGNTGGSMTNVTNIACGSDVTLAANGYTKTGYTFVGWATSADGAKVYNDKATISNITDNISLFAKWEEAPDHIYYYKDATHWDGSKYIKRPDGSAFHSSTGDNISLTTPWTICSGKTGITSIVATGATYDYKGTSSHISAYIKLPTGGSESSKNIKFNIASGYTATVKIKIGGYKNNPTVTFTNATLVSGSVGGVATTEDNFNELTYSIASGKSAYITVSSNSAYISQIDVTTQIAAPTNTAITINVPNGTNGAATATTNSSTLTNITQPQPKAHYYLEGIYTTDALSTKVMTCNADGTNLALVANVSGYTDASGNWTCSDATKTFYAKQLGNNYTLSATLTNVTASPAFGSNLRAGESFTTTISAATGYALPEDFTVTNATKSWNKSTGALTLSNSVGNVSFTIVGVVATPSITAHPQGANYTIGASATSLSVTASANGGTLSYQWQSSSDQSNWTNVGTNQNTYTPSVATAGTTYYRCVVTNTTGENKTATSNTATIVVSKANESVTWSNPTLYQGGKHTITATGQHAAPTITAGTSTTVVSTSTNDYTTTAVITIAGDATDPTLNAHIDGDASYNEFNENKSLTLSPCPGEGTDTRVIYVLEKPTGDMSSTGGSSYSSVYLGYVSYTKSSGIFKFTSSTLADNKIGITINELRADDEITIYGLSSSTCYISFSSSPSTSTPASLTALTASGTYAYKYIVTSDDVTAWSQNSFKRMWLLAAQNVTFTDIKLYGTRDANYTVINRAATGLPTKDTYVKESGYSFDKTYVKYTYMTISPTTMTFTNTYSQNSYVSLQYTQQPQQGDKLIFIGANTSAIKLGYGSSTSVTTFSDSKSLTTIRDASNNEIYREYTLSDDDIAAISTYYSAHSSETFLRIGDPQYTGKYCSDIILAHAVSGSSETDLHWTTDPGETVAKTFDVSDASKNTFTYSAATNSASAGTISYESNNTDVATVDANTGAVTIKNKTGEATITATIAESGCFKTNSISYKVSVTSAGFDVTIARNEIWWGTVTSELVNVLPNTAISASDNVLTIGTTEITATPAPEDNGYTYGFANWTGIPAGGTITANTTVTANFTRTARTYNIIYNTNGGSWEGGNPSVSTYTYGNVTTLATNIAHDGWIFLGWCTDAELTSAYVTSIPADAYGDKTYYAKWDKPQCNSMVVFDGSTMPTVPQGNAKGQEPTSGATWECKTTSTNYGSISKTWNEKTYTTYWQFVGSQTASSARYIKLVIPESYKAVVTLAAYLDNSHTGNKVFISTKATDVATDAYLQLAPDNTGTLIGGQSSELASGTYYICATGIIFLTEVSVQVCEGTAQLCTTPTISWVVAPEDAVVGAATMTASVTTNQTSPSITWESTNTDVATVANGVITYVGAGSTTIKAYYTGDGGTFCARKAEITNDITVSPIWTVWTNMHLGNTWEAISINGDNQASITPAARGTKYQFLLRKQVKSNTSADGAYVFYGAHDAENEIPDNTPWTLNGSNNVNLTSTSVAAHVFTLANLDQEYPRVTVNKPVAYSITFNDNGADGGTAMTNITNIASGASETLPTMTRTKSGNRFTGWKDGSDNSYDDGATISNITADITLTAQWEKKVTSITVSHPTSANTVEVGGTLQLQVSYEPADAEYGTTLTWHSSNGTYLSVDQNGLVTGVGVGNNAYIYVTNNDGVTSNHYIVNVEAPSCPTWSLHLWNGSSTNRNLCFSQVGSTDEWRTDIFSLPSASDDEKCKVLYAGQPSAHAEEWNVTWMQMIGQQSNNCKNSSNKVYYAGQDAVGYARIFASSGDKNSYLAFQPTYVAMLGDGLTNTTTVANATYMEFAYTGETNNYTTPLFIVPAGYKTNNNYKYYVGTKRTSTSSQTPFIWDGKSSVDQLNTVGGLSTSDMAGKWGKLHIYDNSCDANFYCEFIHYRVLDLYDRDVQYGDHQSCLPSASQKAVFSVPDDAPTGYHFDCWRRADGSYSIRQGDADWTNYGIWADYERFNAVWQANTYTITLNKNLGSADGQTTATYDSNTLTSTIHVGNRTGYTLKGYYTTASSDIMVITAEGTLVAGVEGYTDASGNWVRDDDDCTLFAQWTVVPYAINYLSTYGVEHSNPASYTIESETINFADPTGTRTGYTFASWSPASIAAGSTGDKDVTASWNTISYNITYTNTYGVMHENPANYTIETPTITFTDPTTSRTGYNFTGWSPATIALGSTGNQEVAATWEAKTVNVTFNANGGKVAGENTKVLQYTYDGTALVLPTPDDRSGYNFLGWFTLQEGGDQITEVGTTNKPTADVEYFAHWSLVSYSITYNHTYGVTHENPSTYNVESGLITFTNPTSDRTGYNFTGWDPATIAAGSTGNKTIDATWSAINYSISYNNLQGATAPAKNSFTIEDETFSLSDPTNPPSGFTFQGWWTGEGGTGTQVTQIAKGTHENQVLYAKWQKELITPIVTWDDFADASLGELVAFTITTTSDADLTNSITVTGGTLRSTSISGKSITAQVACPTTAGTVTVNFATDATSEYAATPTISKTITVKACQAIPTTIYSWEATTSSASSKVWILENAGGTIGGRFSYRPQGNSQKDSNNKYYYSQDSEDTITLAENLKAGDEVKFYIMNTNSSSARYIIIKNGGTTIANCSSVAGNSIGYSSYQLTQANINALTNKNKFNFKRGSSGVYLHSVEIIRTITGDEEPSLKWNDNASTTINVEYDPTADTHTYNLSAIAGSAGTLTYSVKTDANSLISSYTDGVITLNPVAGTATVQAEVAALGCFTKKTITRTITQTLPNISKPTISIATTGSQSECAGNEGNFGTITTTPACATAGAAFTYQWLKDGAVISGATSDSYTPSAAGTYTCKVAASKTGYTSVTSDASNDLAYTVVALPAATGVTMTNTILVSSGQNYDFELSNITNADTYTLTWSPVGPQAVTEPTSRGDKTHFTGTTGSTPGNYTGTLTFYNSLGCSTEFQLTLNLTVEMTTPVVVTPEDVCAGYSLTFACSNTAGTNEAFYWQTSASGTDKSNLNTITSPTTAGTYTYYVRCYNTTYDLWGDAVSSSAKVLEALTPATLENANYVINAPATALDATATGAVDAKTYQWQSSSDKVVWNDIQGATSATYLPITTEHGTTYYRCQVTSGPCGTVESNVATIAVCGHFPTITAPTSAQTVKVALGEQGTLHVVAAPSQLSSGLYYQWYKGDEAIAGAADADYIFTASAASVGTYYCSVTEDDGCQPTMSYAFNVTVTGVEPTCGWKEIVKATLTSNSAATITGSLKDNATTDISGLSNDAAPYKLNSKPSYFGVSLSTGFKIGDKVSIKIKVGDWYNGASATTLPLNVFSDKGSTALYSSEYLAKSTDNTIVEFVLDKDVNSIYVYRASSGENTQNHQLYYISVSRYACDEGVMEFTDATGDHNWSTVGNWIGTTNPATSLPTEGTITHIKAPVTVSTKDAQSARVDLWKGTIDETNYEATLTIAPTGGLNVVGDVKIFNGTNRTATTTSDITIQSTAAGNGALVFANDGTSAATVQLFSKAYTVKEDNKNKKYWQYIGMPINVGDVLDVFSGAYLYLYHEESGWEKINAYNPAYPWKGYGVAYNKPQDALQTYQFAGQLMPSTTQELTLTNTKDGAAGANLIANSWTAPINIRQFDLSDFEGAQATVYVYNTGKDLTKTGSYADGESATAGQWSTYPINTVKQPLWAGATTIASMQGFEVDVLPESSSATLTLDYDRLVRPATGSPVGGNIMRAPARSTDTEIEPEMIFMRVADTNTYADIYLLQHQDFSVGFDNGWDGSFVDGDGRSPMFYSVSDTLGKMTVNATNDWEGISVGFTPGKGTMHSISFNYNGLSRWYLNDIKTQSSTLINATSIYNFLSEEGDDEARFYISAIPFQQETPTGITNLDAADQVKKIIYKEHLYLINNGVVYDGQGKLVK